MRKLILCFILVLISNIGRGQEFWYIGEPGKIIYRDYTIKVELGKDWMNVCINQEKINPWTIDVTLLDSLGDPVREWKNLNLRDPEEELTYRTIYRYSIDEMGWIVVGENKIPTMRKEEEEYD